MADSECSEADHVPHALLHPRLRFCKPYIRPGDGSGYVQRPLSAAPPPAPPKSGARVGRSARPLYPLQPHCVCVVTYLTGLLWPGGDARPIHETAKALSPLGGKRAEEAHTRAGSRGCCAPGAGSSPVHQATQGRTRRTGLPSLPQQGITGRNPLSSTAASSQARTRDKAVGCVHAAAGWGEGSTPSRPPGAGLKQQSQEVWSLLSRSEHPGREERREVVLFGWGFCGVLRRSFLCPVVARAWGPTSPPCGVGSHGFRYCSFGNFHPAAPFLSLSCL